jgi:hypothetical protein
MSTGPTEVLALLTAAEFARMPDPGYPEGLVRGSVMPLP